MTIELSSRSLYCTFNLPILENVTTDSNRIPSGDNGIESSTTVTSGNSQILIVSIIDKYTVLQYSTRNIIFLQDKR